MMARTKRGQGLMEYLLMLLLVVAAIAAMTAYFMRATHARLLQSKQELDYYKGED
jgi:uncharacterized protein (UPF0333 family)